MLERNLNSADRARIREGMDGKLPKLAKLDKLEIVYLTHVVVSKAFGRRLV